MVDEYARKCGDRLAGMHGWSPPALLLKNISRDDRSLKTIDDVLDVVRKFAVSWDLRIERPFHQLTYNFVALVTSSFHGPAVLKIAFDAKKFAREFAALRAFDGHGSVRLLEHDEDCGAMLLERADPGSPMTLDWDERTEAFAELVKILWKPAPVESILQPIAKEAKFRLSELKKMAQLLSDNAFADRAAIVVRAHDVLSELANSSDERFILHGDLHSQNVLSSHRSPWLSIDPLGCVGERAFDVTALLRNDSRELRGSADSRAMVDRRINQLSTECGLDDQRVRAWSFVEAVRTQGWRYRAGKPLDEWSSIIALLEP